MVIHRDDGRPRYGLIMITNFQPEVEGDKTTKGKEQSGKTFLSNSQWTELCKIVAKRKWTHVWNQVTPASWTFVPEQGENFSQKPEVFSATSSSQVDIIHSLLDALPGNARKIMNMNFIFL